MIFISHADEDRQLARRLCEALEKAGAKCWIAPRDVTPGKNYAVEIMRGIEHSDAVVLLLSEHANASSMVGREIERAVSKNKRVIELRSAEPAPALEFLLAGNHWIDAGDAPIEQLVDQILHAMRSAEDPRRAQHDEEGAQREAGERADLQQGEAPRKVPIAWRRAALVAALLLLASLVVVLVLPRVRQEPERQPAAPAEAPQATLRVAAVGEMVKIPSGAFWMGCNEKVDKECDENEKPGRSVDVQAFSMDRTEVTVAQYRLCGACTDPGTHRGCNWNEVDRETHPINCVNWSQAKAYCEWAGKRLPSEAEWEKAARGTEGRKYPWGNEWSADKANVGAESTTPVGSFPAGASPYGGLDMSGNVWEWVSDEVAAGRGLRGGSWSVSARNARASYRNSIVPAARSADIGFRCAQ